MVRKRFKRKFTCRGPLHTGRAWPQQCLWVQHTAAWLVAFGTDQVGSTHIGASLLLREASCTMILAAFGWLCLPFLSSGGEVVGHAIRGLHDCRWRLWPCSLAKQYLKGECPGIVHGERENSALTHSPTRSTEGRHDNRDTKHPVLDMAASRCVTSPEVIQETTLSMFPSCWNTDLSCVRGPTAASPCR
jgi:hypothetical protein